MHIFRWYTVTVLNNISMDLSVMEKYIPDKWTDRDNPIYILFVGV